MSKMAEQKLRLIQMVLEMDDLKDLISFGKRLEKILAKKIECIDDINMDAPNSPTNTK
jgi:hypothetical protein